MTLLSRDFGGLLTCAGRGRPLGGFSSPEGNLRGWRRDCRARPIRREEVKEGKENPGNGKGREHAAASAGLSGARPWDHAAVRDEAGRPGRCSARVPRLAVAARSLAPSLPALRALRPFAAPGKPAVLTARRAGRAGEVWQRRPSAPTPSEPRLPSVLGHGTPWRRPRVRATALLGILPGKLAGTLPRHARPTRGRVTVGAPLPPPPNSYRSVKMSVCGSELQLVRR